jgi:hypothetical protein
MEWPNCGGKSRLVPSSKKRKRRGREPAPRSLELSAHGAPYRGAGDRLLRVTEGHRAARLGQREGFCGEARPARARAVRPRALCTLFSTFVHFS